jgi:hypothetical protein
VAVQATGRMAGSGQPRARRTVNTTAAASAQWAAMKATSSERPMEATHCGSPPKAVMAWLTQ